MASQDTQQETSSTSNVPVDEPPLWVYVTKIEKIGNGISICKKSTTSDKLEMRRLEESHEEKKAQSKEKEVGLPCEASADFKKRKGTSSSIERLFGVEIKDQLDQEIARMFYTGGLPFNLARNPHYVRAFRFAAENKIVGYVPPSYNKLRTTLLQKEKENVQRLLEPVRFSWKEKGVSIVSDGWSDPTRKPLINFMATSGSGPMFLKAVNCFGDKKDKNFIADLMKEVINEIGHQNVVQIITDNAANCKAAGEIMESQFPHIFWTPCVVHTLNLALKNICSPRNVETNATPYEECKWIQQVHTDALAIKNFIMNHNMRLSILNKFSPIRLLSVADTRFASIIVMLKRLKLIKRGLQAMVISEEWSSYRDDDTVKANIVKEKILDDEWWEKVSYILSFTRPIYEMIRVCDTDKPCLHLVHEMWESMIEKVKIEIYKKERRRASEKSFFYDVVHTILKARWTKNNTPLHCLAHFLNPRYYSDAWLLENSKRSAPHRDGEISRERMRCFKRLFPNNDEYNKVLDEYAHFSMKSGPFEDLTCITQMSSMEPKNWWVNFGAQTPFLQSLAFKVLGQPSSSSCAERNWSTYAFIHSLRRNKLNTSRAEDLVYVHNNLRLLSRNPNDDVKTWDVGGDAFDSMEDAGFLEVADLSLDEPEFENELII